MGMYPLFADAEDRAQEYRALQWQVVTDDLGFTNVHETDEDGGPGDLVAEVYGDHLKLIVAAPELLKAAQIALETLAPRKDDDFVWATMTQLIAAIAKARGEQS